MFGISLPVWNPAMRTLPQVSFVLSLIAIVGLPTLGLAQIPKPPTEQLEATGILKGVAPGGVLVATEGSGNWKIALPREKNRITFSGSADLEFLKPGMAIRFNATISNKGAVLNEISAITVFTPQARGDLGIQPEGQAGPNPAEGLFADDKEPKKPQKPPEEFACLVAGELISLKGKKMLVSAAGTVLKCELAENATVDVRLHDLSYAQLGDKVNLRGWYYPQMKEAGAQATELDITATNPLVDLKKKQKTQGKDVEKPAEAPAEK